MLRLAASSFYVLPRSKRDHRFLAVAVRNARSEESMTLMKKDLGDQERFACQEAE